MSDPNVERNRFRKGNLRPPLVIIGATDEQLFIVREGDENNPDADAQLYDLREDKLLNEIKPIGVWLKFMYIPVEGFIPPIPYTPEAVARFVETFKAAQRARAAAEDDE